MKSWQEIKDNYSREQGYDDWSEILYSADDPNELDTHIDAVSLLRAKQALESASESFKTIETRVCSYIDLSCIDKESITDIENIPQ